MRSWGELGRRLSLADVETAISFFAEGVSNLRDVPQAVHPLVFQLCSRQITLSSAIAIETFRNLPALAEAINDDDLLAPILEVAGEIARRSAKHSAEFLNQTPEVITRLRRLRNPEVVKSGIELAAEFASRAGGIAADAWAALPAAIGNVNAEDAMRLMDHTVKFLERGGGSALQVLITGGELLRTLPEIFEEWVEAVVDRGPTWQRQPGSVRSQQRALCAWPHH